MANQTIGVNLKFSADVSAAKRAMSELQSSLAQINQASMNTKISTQYTSELNRASQAAAQLRIQLQNAFNQDTGKLNLAKFNQSLKNSGMNIAKYKQELSLLGPQGEQAFNKLAYSIATAETRTLSLSHGMQRLGTTFMNTLRYQLSSSLIMGFVQSLQEAINYTKELNTSLNNIRIVTNYGVDEMKEFANYANKAAKALSTTTKAMTDASLIYFQQGLNMQEAQKRAETTVKLANVTGESVGTVSDQLTAIWNNFYDGSKALEYYADVITALGAVTASSSDEISQGLEKFAAVADTVGLSYEYATAALATVTAQTRQSADVVGTAFKTLFARIQDLELGNTLDDGVTLGQYSQGLAAIGVEILDTSGNLKDMNTILNEMGATWNNLSKAQQVSVAQTVAGVRQYTQLIALMDNWSYFQENLLVAESSSGTLTKQQEIYAESWEATAQRVKAASEELYGSLFKDDTFIDIMDNFADFIGVVDKLAESLGGLPGIVSILGMALTRLFAPQIINGANNLAASMMTILPSGRKALSNMQTEATNAIVSNESKGMAGIEAASVRQKASIRQAYNRNSAKMSEETRSVAELSMNEYERKVDKYLNSNQTIANQEYVQDADQAILKQKMLNRNKGYVNQQKKLATDRLSTQLGAEEFLKQEDLLDSLYENIDESYAQNSQSLRQSSAAKQLQGKIGLKDSTAFSSLTQGVPTDTTQIAAQAKSLEELELRLRSIGIEAGNASAQLKDVVGDNVAQEYEEYYKKVEKVKAALQQLQQAEQSGDTDQIDIARKAYDTELQGLNRLNTNIETNIDDMGRQATANLEMVGANEDFITSQKQAGDAMGETHREMSNLTQEGLLLEDGMEKAGNASMNFGQKVQSAAQMAMTVSMAFNAIKGAIDTLNDPDMSGLEKTMSILSSLSMVAMMAASSLQSLNLVQTLNTMGQKMETKAQLADIAVNKIHSKSEIDLKNAKSGSGSGGTINGGNGGKGLTKAGGKALGASLAVIAIVIAAIAGAKAIYKAADEAYRKDEIAAERAAKAAQNLAEVNQKAKESFDKFAQSTETYTSKVDSLKNMTKGTAEYQEAISAANEESLRMIHTYKELAGQYHTTAEGLIVFNEGALENVRLLELQRKNAAAAAEAVARHNANEAQAKADATKIAREELKGDTSERTIEDKSIARKGGAIGLGAGAVGAGAAALGGAFAGTKLGATFGSFAGPIGTAIGAAAGAIIGVTVGGVVAAVNKKEATKNEQKAIDTLTKAYATMGESALTPDNMKKLLADQGIHDEKLIESLEANLAETDSSLKELCEEVRANTLARRIENKNLAREQFMAQDAAFGDFSSEVQTAASEIGGKIRTDLENKIEYKNTAKGATNSTEGVFWKGWHNGTAWGEATVKEYLEAQGFKNIDAKNFRENDVKVKYLNTETNEYETKFIDYETIAAWKEGEVIAKEIDKSYDSIKNNLFDLEQMSGGSGALSIIGGQDVNTLTKAQIDELKAAYNNPEFKAELAELGTIAGEDYTKAIENAIEQWDPDKALTNYMRKVEAEVQNILDAGAQETGVSAQALENYSEVLAKNSKALNGNGKALSEWEKTANSKIAADMAVANAKFAKGIVALNEVMGKSINILQEWNEGSLETWESVAEVQTALEDVFGVKVSANFVREKLQEIGELAQGDISKLEELQQAAAKDFVMNLDISQASRNNMSKMLDDFIAQAQEFDANLTVGAKLDMSSYTEQLNEMLKAGDITAEEVKKTFAAIGYAVDIRTTQKEVTNTSEFSMVDPVSKQVWKGQITNKSVMDVPYIAGEDTYVKGTETTLSTGETTTVGHQDTGDGFTYTGGTSTKGALIANLGKEANKDIAKNRKKIEEEYDYLHEENAILEDIERALNRVSKAKDRAYGNKKVAYIKEEIRQLKEQLKVLEQSEEILYSQVVTKARDLTAKYGAEFSVTGQISNWEEIQDTMLKYYEKEWEAARKISNEERMEELDEWLENWKDAFADYEEILNALKDNREKQTDAANEAFDKELEALQVPIELKIEIEDRGIKLLEFQIEHLDDSIHDTIDAIIKLGEVTERSLDKVDLYRTGIEAIFKDQLSKDQISALLDMGDLSALEGIDLTSGQIDYLLEYQDKLYEVYDNLDKFHESVMEQVNKYFEAENNKADKIISKIENSSNLLEHYRNVIDLVGKKPLGMDNETLLALSGAQIEASKSQLSALYTQLKANEDMLAQAKEQRAKYEEDSDEAKYWDEQIDTINEKVQDLTNNIHSSFENTLKLLADDFALAIETTLESFEKSMTGIYGSYDKMQEYLDQQSEINSRHLADYEKVYELSKLNRDITNSIDDSASVKSKKILRDLQEEIVNYQKSGEKMSRYELEHLQKKYNLRLAQIALEEAQNAKSTVRMRRDSEGNWSYIYTADQDNIDQAQQNYEDKLYEIQAHGQEYIDEMQQYAINAEREMVEALANLRVEDFENVEAYQEEVARITEYYTGKRDYALGELNKAIEDSAEIYESDYSAYSNYSGQKLNEDKRLTTSFRDLTMAQIRGYDSIEDASIGFANITNEITEELVGYYGDWQDKVTEVFNTIGEDFTTFAKPNGKVATAVDKMGSKLDELNQAMNKWGSNARKGFEDIAKAASDKFNYFQNRLKPYKDYIEDLLEKLNQIVEYEGTKPPPETVQPGENEGENVNTQTGNVPKGNPLDTDSGGNKTFTPTPAPLPLPSTSSTELELYADGSPIDNEQTSGLGRMSASLSDDQLFNSILEKNGNDYYLYDKNNSYIGGYVAQNQVQMLLNKGVQLVDSTPKPQKKFNAFIDWYDQAPREISFTQDDPSTIERVGYDIRTNNKPYYIKLKGDSSLYYMTPQQIQEIIDFTGFTGDGAERSGSGDLLINDPPMEVGDRVKSNTDSLPAVMWKGSGFSRIDKLKYGLVGNRILSITDTGIGIGYYTGLLSTGEKGNDQLARGDADGNYLGPLYEQYRAKTDNLAANGAFQRVWYLYDSKRPANFQSYDTGGYTGSWDSSGRLAMLHQKEIVLNAHDTENFLAAVNIVRDVAKAIDLKAIAYQHELAKMTYSMNLGEMGQTLQQDITIHAEFPNAKERSEIEAAFDTLLNRASQFANRKN